MPISLELASTLGADRERVWQAITSMDEIREEMWPLARMTSPASLPSLAEVEPGKPLFRSWLLAAGFLPIDVLDLTLVEIDPGRGFVEESPILSMKLWRHERRIEGDGAPVVVRDRLTFEPRFAAPLVAAIVRRFFEHRHAVLRRKFP